MRCCDDGEPYRQSMGHDGPGEWQVITSDRQHRPVEHDVNGERDRDETKRPGPATFKTMKRGWQRNTDRSEHEPRDTDLAYRVGQDEDDAETAYESKSEPVDHRMNGPMSSSKRVA